MLPLEEVIAAVEAEGARLRAEFYAPQGPRGRRGSCPADAEIEQRLRGALLALIACRFIGEETAAGAGPAGGYVWVVDPHDGTFEFMSGRRGSAISVGLLRDGVPVLGVVHAPDAPDRGPDTIAWAEGCGPIRRNGAAVHNDLSQQRVHPGALVWATASAAAKPVTWSLAAAPGRYVAMPSIAYRLARIAAGDGVATASVHAVAEYDVAGGLALVRAARGTMLDAEGREVQLRGEPGARLSGCFAGAPEAARALAAFNWKALDDEPRHEPRVTLGFPRKDIAERIARAQGCLLGLVIGDSLAAAQVHHTLAGQPAQAGEMAIALARALVRDGGHQPDKVIEAYRAWMTSRPVDVGVNTEKGLLGTPDMAAESSGSLLRIAPIGIFAAGDPALAARLARDDCALTHPSEACLEACAGYAAAVATGVAGGERRAMLDAALAHAKGAARDAIERAPHGATQQSSSALACLQDAFHALLNLSFEQSATRSPAAAALAGALHGRSAVPSHWLLPILACRPLAEAAALRPRPLEYWPDDLLELADALLVAGPLTRGQ